MMHFLCEMEFFTLMLGIFMLHESETLTVGVFYVALNQAWHVVTTWHTLR